MVIPAVVNGWAERLRAVREFVNSPGGVAISVLAFFLAMLAGWIPSPMMMILAELQEHRRDAEIVVTRNVLQQAELVRVLRSLTMEIGERNRRDRLIECGRFQDSELRRLCFRSVDTP